MIPSILEAAVRALLAAATVWAGLRLLGVSNVRAQKAAWGLVLASALLMPLWLPLALRSNWLPHGATVVVPAHPWRLASETPPAKPARSLAEAASTPALAPSSYTDAAPESRVALPENPAAPTFSKAGLSASGSTIETPLPLARHRTTALGALIPPPATLAGLLYLAGCAALLLRLLYGLVSALSLWHAAEPVHLASRHAAGLHLRSSRAVSSPVTIGSGVVLPDDYGEWDGEKLRIVLAHERSHIRQGDFYLQLLAGLYAALFWFSPLGWWLKRKLSDLGEAISDRAGLEEAASRSSYAQILLEFAALPRPTVLGVAMARTSSLSHRIERLLNDTSFRQAFAGSRRRALLAVLLVPAALFAATALIRVQAAEAARPAAALQATPPAPAQAPLTGQSNPDQAPDTAAPAAQAPATPPAPANPPAPAPPSGPGSTVVPEGAPSTPPPPGPPDGDSNSVIVGKGKSLTITNTHNNQVVTAKGKGSGHGRGYGYSWSSDRDSYAFVTGPDEHVSFSGDWNSEARETIDKSRKLAHGKFLWFTHDGKSYIVDDPAITAGIEAMYRPMEALGAQQEALGKQQEELGKQQEELGRRQEQASVPTPDMSKEIAKLNEALAKLEAKRGSTVTQEELAEIQGRIGDIQGKLGDIEGKIGEVQGRLGEQQGKLGEQQGKLGEQQGKLGEEQGRIAQEADRKIKSIIDESLRNGKARPVE